MPSLATRKAMVFPLRWLIPPPLMGSSDNASRAVSWQAAAMIGTQGGTPERPALFFSGAEEFAAWLEANHDTATELWMGLYKKHVGERGLTWEDAVLEAL